MTIRITPREGGVPTCPYCLDAVPVGPACPGCATRYHDECAVTFGRCATLGCKATLDQGPRPTGRALPRLAAIAARLAGSASPAPWLDDDEGQSFLALVPSPGHAARGAEVLAELLGQTLYDARLRLSSGLPEPLLRLPTAADAERARQRLEGQGLAAVVIPARRFLAPLDRLEVASVDLTTLRLVDAAGVERLLPAAQERLVVSAQLHEVSTVTETTRDERGGVRWGATKSARVRKARRCPAALVFSGSTPTPTLLSRDGTRIDGTSDPTAYGRWTQLAAALQAGAAHVDLSSPSANVTLLSMRRPVSPQTPGEDNVAGLLLAARILHAAWRGS